jgi:GntR family transcriptional regulator
MANPLVRIDSSSPVPIVRQISDQLRVLLVEGSLGPGSALPPVRRLAMELVVHFNTVAEAYRQLAAEGWLDLRRGRGAVVAERETPAASRQEVAGYRQRLRELVSQTRAQGVPLPRIVSELRAIAEEVEGL